jgi:hypothetical protein
MEKDPNFDDVYAHDRCTNTWFSVECTLNSGALEQNAHQKESAPTASPETCAAGVLFSLKSTLTLKFSAKAKPLEMLSVM